MLNCMNRFVSLLLIPLFVLGQVLPHSHAGSGVVEPDDHSARPHVHLSHSHHEHGDGHEHGHEHDTVVSSLDGFTATPHSANHDHDAVYFAASTVFASRAVVATQFEWSTMLDLPLPSTLAIGELRSCSRISDPPDRCSPIPIYLLVASLRL